MISSGVIKVQRALVMCLFSAINFLLNFFPSKSLFNRFADLAQTEPLGGTQLRTHDLCHTAAHTHIDK